MKPKLILELEKLRGIEITDYKSEEVEFSANNTYRLNDKNEIIFLNLASNDFSDFSFLESFEHLETLILNHNIIDDFAFLRRLNRLDGLYLGDCHLKDFTFLKSVPKIKKLVLFNNDISDISFLQDVIQLEALYISDNKILDISILSTLNELDTLSLRGNVISNISSLQNLLKLKYIDLSKNKISDITPLKEIIRNGILLHNKRGMGFRKGIYIDGNPLQTPSYDIIKQGTAAVIRFFNKVEKEGVDRIYEAKVTLVGEGRAGKTSLICRLINSKSLLPTEEKRTRGIDIQDWEFKKSSTTKHIAHIWDFGGQDVYYPVHRFFLTEDSVFVLLASTRQNTHDFDYWIPTIFQFGGQSPIILGQTCHDGLTKHWNDIGVYLANENFNIIKDQTQSYYEINLLKNNKGLLSIKKTIINQIVKLPHYKKSVPKSWIPVRDLITKLKKYNCISYVDLKQKIYETNPQSFVTKEDFEDCIKFFHSIGILLWYHKEEKLKNWVILDPKWAVDAVYKIIDYKKQTNKGIILSKDFDNVWSAKMYDDKHIILKEMLEVFKIAFPKKTNKADYIMPTRLESIPTEKIWSNFENCLSIVYNFQFMPKGMVNQISAELSRYIASDEEVWNNAVNFKDNETVGQVFEDYYERMIIVKAKGNDARGIIKLVMNAIENITDGYKGVRSDISIPCICKECLNSSKPNMYPYELLLNKLKEKRLNITCILSDLKLEIETLLFNIGLPNPTEIDAKNEVLETEKLSEDSVVESEERNLKVFVTYSWTDKDGKFDENHQNKVGKFVHQLRIKWGIDASFDLHKEETNFVKMMYENLSKNDKIIIVLSDGYSKKADDFKGGVGTEYQGIINDISQNPLKYIFISLQDRNYEIYPFGFKGNDTIVLAEDLLSDDLPENQNRLLSKLMDDPIVDIPEIGKVRPKVKKRKFD